MNYNSYEFEQRISLSIYARRTWNNKATKIFEQIRRYLQLKTHS